MLMVDRGVVTFFDLNTALLLFGGSVVVLISSTVYLVKTSDLKRGLDTLNKNLEESFKEK